ncbi:unnamed protein product [Amoebophrya sp. A120]|nr:unnamed protein product [Amoebophrya sp. A120]|eukprot:GSA120T00010711001.1
MCGAVSLLRRPDPLRGGSPVRKAAFSSAPINSSRSSHHLLQLAAILHGISIGVTGKCFDCDLDINENAISQAPLPYGAFHGKCEHNPEWCHWSGVHMCPTVSITNFQNCPVHGAKSWGQRVEGTSGFPCCRFVWRGKSGEIKKEETPIEWVKYEATHGHLGGAAAVAQAARHVSPTSGYPITDQYGYTMQYGSANSGLRGGGVVVIDKNKNEHHAEPISQNVDTQTTKKQKLFWNMCCCLVFCPVIGGVIVLCIAGLLFCVLSRQKIASEVTQPDEGDVDGDLYDTDQAGVPEPTSIGVAGEKQPFAGAETTRGSAAMASQQQAEGSVVRESDGGATGSSFSTMTQAPVSLMERPTPSVRVPGDAGKITSHSVTMANAFSTATMAPAPGSLVDRATPSLRGPGKITRPSESMIANPPNSVVSAARGTTTTVEPASQSGAPDFGSVARDVK